MGITANWKKYSLEFKFLAKTSRDELRTRDIWIIKLEQNHKIGFGECAMLAGLSIDDRSNFENILHEVCAQPEYFKNDPELLKQWPSIRFGLEMAFRSLQSENALLLFPSVFTDGKYDIPMNGLVWMGSKEYMEQQVEDKLKAGFKCIKMKIGAINWEDEISLIRHLRNRFSREEIEIRVDANGAFNEKTVFRRLEELAQFDLHSIEQPVKAGQHELLKKICNISPLPIALDEELIPLVNSVDRRELLEYCQPQYLVLKPSLLGGFASSQEWINLANELQIKYWVTSALESNLGLNALSQWVATLNPTHIYQGLGTGQLYHNNFSSPLQVKQGKMHFDPAFNLNFKEIWGE